jgi:hypothetical protein
LPSLEPGRNELKTYLSTWKLQTLLLSLSLQHCLLRSRIRMLDVALFLPSVLIDRFGVRRALRFQRLC